MGGSILALICVCLLGTYYLCVFVFSFGLFGRGLLYLIDLIERLARPIFSVIDEAISKSISHSSMELSTVYPFKCVFRVEEKDFGGSFSFERKTTGTR